MTSASSNVTLRNSAEWELDAPDGYTYLIQVSWPLQWKERAGHEGVAVLYLLDGNSVFLTATEAAWRRASAPHFAGGGLIVSVGHKLKDDFLFSSRRNQDLTPPSAKSAPGHGGADSFIKFINDQLKPFVRSTVLANSTVGYEALFGHSYGGLFTLYTMFTHPTSFDCFFAGSPSIWYDDWVLLESEKRFTGGSRPSSPPTLLMFYGSLEQDPSKRTSETDDTFLRRRQSAQSRAMKESVISMVQRLRKSENVKYVNCKEYPGEDHGTVIGCGLGRAVATFFEDWPFSSDTSF
ncbi:hypothetical protein V2A60_004286 [Cordyceps javanica]|uniref:Siderophore esterase IroE-like n=1 Tax=Cordyceps javanica TaxID=43265 RepID=A0A545ULJ8_9HYPO|nr:siderophore esterase IroE-like [Cordyceps javanica]TQW01800.1 siderophore esterase IroE-like [Cordyceps javanica]